MTDFPFRTLGQIQTIAGGRQRAAVAAGGPPPTGPDGRVAFSDYRAPGAPEYMDALTVCVKGPTHQDLHKELNGGIAGTANAEKVTTFRAVVEQCFKSIDKIPDNQLSQKCKAVYKAALLQQYAMPLDTELRGTTATPKPETSLPTLQRAWGFTP